MQLQTTANQLNTISHYDQTSLTTNIQKYEQSVLITSQNITVIKKNINELDSLTKSELPLENNIDLLIIGGHKVTPLNMPYKLQKELFFHKVSLEIMELGAACRTFNILRSESRDIACLILF